MTHWLAISEGGWVEGGEMEEDQGVEGRGRVVVRGGGEGEGVQTAPRILSLSLLLWHSPLIRLQ